MTEVTGKEVAVQGGSGVLAVRPDQREFTEEQQAVLAQMFPKDKPQPTRADIMVLLNHAQRTGLDPFIKQIYMIQRAGRWGIQTSIDGFRLIAERTGRYDGQTPQEWCGEDGVWREVWLEGKPPYAARCGVYKKGAAHPTYAVARYSEYMDSKSPMWAKMPATMISKCAEALALRKAFPQDLSGIYADVEMDQADHDDEPRNAVVDAPPVDLNDEAREEWAVCYTSAQVAHTVEELRQVGVKAASHAGLLDASLPPPRGGEPTSLRQALLDFKQDLETRLASGGTGALPPEVANAVPPGEPLEGEVLPPEGKEPIDPAAEAEAKEASLQRAQARARREKGQRA